LAKNRGFFVVGFETNLPLTFTSMLSWR